MPRNEQQQSNWLVKCLVFLLSVLVFSLAFGLALSWQTVPILLVVILIHELGHWLGMKIFGFRDLQIFFIPLLGAATTGRKDEATPGQHLIVYLLGPLPGILLGIAFLYIFMRTGERLWLEFGVFAIILNYFNLLPITPLDGGRIVETLVFARFPRLKFFFTIGSFGILALLAWRFGETILLAFVILLFIGLPSQWKLHNMTRKIVKTLPHDLSRQEYLQAIFTTLGNPPFQDKPFAERVNIAKTILQQLSTSLPSLKMTIVGMLVYILLLIPSIGILVYIYGGGGVAPLVRMMSGLKQPDWEKKLRKATSEDEYWNILMEAGQWYADYAGIEDYSKAEEYFREALERTRHFAEDDVRTVKCLHALAEVLVLEKPEEAKTYYHQALAKLESIDDPEKIRAAEILESLVWLEERNSTKQIEYLERALAIRQEYEDEKTTSRGMLYTLQTLAELYEEAGRIDEAESTLQHVLSGYQADSEQGQVPVFILEKIANFYLRQNQTNKAQSFLQKHYTLLRKAPDEVQHYALSHLVSLLGWTHVTQENFERAAELFSQALEHYNQSLIARSQKRGYEDIAKIPLLLDAAYVALKENNSEAANTRFLEAKKILEKSGMFEDYVKRLQEDLQRYQHTERMTWELQRRMAHAEVVRHFSDL